MAVIAVLVAVAIPTFTNQLEKSRQAVDVSNLRGAYAQARLAEIDQAVNGSPFKATANAEKNNLEYWYNPDTGSLTKADSEETSVSVNGGKGMFGKATKNSLSADVSQLPGTIGSDYSTSLNTPATDVGTLNKCILVTFGENAEENSVYKISSIKFVTAASEFEEPDALILTLSNTLTKTFTAKGGSDTDKNDTSGDLSDLVTAVYYKGVQIPKTKCEFSGTLPAGLSLGTDGKVTGPLNATDVTDQECTITVTGADTAGAAATKTATFKVKITTSGYST